MYSNPIVTQESRGSHRAASVHSIRQLQWSLSSHTLGAAWVCSQAAPSLDIGSKIKCASVTLFRTILPLRQRWAAMIRKLGFQGTPLCT